MKNIIEILEKKRKTLALVLFFVMMMDLLCPLTAVASESTVSDPSIPDFEQEEVSDGTDAGELQGTGTKADPYRIEDKDDWEAFCDALENTDKYNGFKGKYVKLTHDISVSRMASSRKWYAFCGDFDGGNNKITVSYYGQDYSPLNQSECAPFRYTGGNASIRNVRTAGKIITSGSNVSGLVGCMGDSDGDSLLLENCHVSVEIQTSAERGGCLVGEIPMLMEPANVSANIINCSTDSYVYTSSRYFGGFSGYTGGNTTFRGCVCSAVIESTYDGEGWNGGFIGYARSRVTSNIHIDDCIFNGTFKGYNTSRWSGITGGRSDGYAGKIYIDNVIFDPKDLIVENEYNSSIYNMNKNVRVNSFYYTREFGSYQGGIKVYRTASPGNIYRKFESADNRTYYSECEVTGIRPLYKCMVIGETIDIDVQIKDDTGNVLSKDDDYSVIVTDKSGNWVDPVELPGKYTVIVNINDTGDYVGSYTQGIIVDYDPAQDAVITSQPEPLALVYGYRAGNGFSVSVEEDPDFSFSYQWYENTVPSTVSGDKIEGASGNELLVEPGLDAGFKRYYYCEITSTRKATGLSSSIFSDIAMLTVQKRGAAVTALDQSVSLNGVINRSVDQAVLSNAAEGHELFGVTLESTSTAEVSKNGIITPSDAVIMCNGTDVTDNYDIHYVTGRLEVFLEDEPQQQSESESQSVSDDGLIHEQLVTDVKDEKGNHITIDIYHQKSVSYNSLKHVAAGYSKAGKKSRADYAVSINSILNGYATPVLKFKNNKNAYNKNGKKAFFTLSYKAAKGISKELKVTVKNVNAYLKKRPVDLIIDRADLGKVRVVEFKTKKDKIKKLVVETDGITIKLSKKDYDIKTNADGTFTITGKNNFCGTLTLGNK